MYKACIFDLDGTLTDTLESITYSVNVTLQELGLREITSGQCKEFIGNGARYLIERSLQAAGDETLDHVEHAMDIYGRVFKKNCTYRVDVYEGIVDLLRGLKEQGLMLAVLSNKPHLQTVDVVKTFFDKEVFTCVQGQQETIPRKPDPTAALLIAERFGAEAKDVIYIGDSDVDMQTGRAAGMTTVGVTWGFRPKEVLIAHGADYIIDKPEELITIVKNKGAE